MHTNNLSQTIASGIFPPIPRSPNRLAVLPRLSEKLRCPGNPLEKFSELQNDGVPNMRGREPNLSPSNHSTT